MELKNVKLYRLPIDPKNGFPQNFEVISNNSLYSLYFRINTRGLFLVMKVEQDGKLIFNSKIVEGMVYSIGDFILYFQKISIKLKDSKRVRIAEKSITEFEGTEIEAMIALKPSNWHQKYSPQLLSFEVNNLPVYPIKEDTLIKIIARAINISPKKYCIFLGAGASFPSIPLAKDLMKQMIDKFGYTEKDIIDLILVNTGKAIDTSELTLEMVTHALERSIGREVLQFLRRLLNGRKNPTKGISSLVNVIRKKSINFVFTTNLDELLEIELDKKLGVGRYKKLITIEDYKSNKITDEVSTPYIFKLHGTYSQIETILMTQDDVQRLSEHKALFLKHYLREYGFIFVGYSGKDPDIKKVIDKCATERKDIKIYWVSPESSFDLNNTVKEILKRYNGTTDRDFWNFHIRKTSDEFFKDLEKETEELSIHVLKKDFAMEWSEGGYDLKMQNGDIMWVSGRDNLKQGIELRLATKRGEDFLNPKFGSNLYRLYGVENPEIVKEEGKMYIIEALKEESGIEDIINVDVCPVNRNKIQIKLEIVPIDRPEPLKWKFNVTLDHNKVD